MSIGNRSWSSFLDVSANSKCRGIYACRPGPVRPCGQSMGPVAGFRDPWLRDRTRRLYEPIVRPGDTVIDVGANLGVHTKAFLDLGAHVTAYEPNPYCRNVLNNRFRNENRLRMSGSGICAGTESRMETFHVCEAHCMSTFSKCEEFRPANREVEKDDSDLYDSHRQSNRPASR